MKVSLLLAVFLFLCLVACAQTRHLDPVRKESSVTYGLVHPLHKIEATSKDVQFILEADPSKKEIKGVSAQVDVTTFDSGNSNRDSHAMEVIDAISYPDARFESTSITQTGDSISVAGKITFHGVTREVVMKGTTQWSANKLVVHGGFELSLAAFNIDRPSLLMIPVEDVLKFVLVAAFEWN